MSGKHKAVQSIPRCVVNFLKKPRILVGSNTGCWIPHATTDNVEGSLQLELRNNGLTSSAARLKWYESMVSRGSATQNNHENHNNQSSRSQHKLHEDERMKRWSRSVLSSCCGSAEHCIPARLTSTTDQHACVVQARCLANIPTHTKHQHTNTPNCGQHTANSLPTNQLTANISTGACDSAVY